MRRNDAVSFYVLSEPAFRVIQTAKLQNSDITTQQHLQTLQDVFGRPSQSGGVYYELLSTFQHKEEQVLQRVVT